MGFINEINVLFWHGESLFKRKQKSHRTKRCDGFF